MIKWQKGPPGLAPRSAVVKFTCIKVGFDHLIHATTQMRPNLLAKRTCRSSLVHSSFASRWSGPPWSRSKEQLVSVLNGVHSSTWT
jgi:hypothetical protein